MLQTRPIAKQKLLSLNADYKQFNSRVMELEWILQTCPEITCSISILAQVTETFLEARSKNIQFLNKIIRIVNGSPNLGIAQITLDLDTMYIWAYADGYFSNNQDLGSQLGYIVFLCDDQDNATLLALRSFKSR